MGDIVGNKEAIVQYRYTELAANSNETVNMKIPYIIWVLASLSSDMAAPCAARSGLSGDFNFLCNLNSKHPQIVCS